MTAALESGPQVRPQKTSESDRRPLRYQFGRGSDLSRKKKAPTHILEIPKVLRLRSITRKNHPVGTDGMPNPLSDSATQKENWFREKRNETFMALRPVAELDSRATLTLLTSLVLIGIVLAGQKPVEVQILGFTLQADNWIYLAFALVLVILYLAYDLWCAWRIEMRVIDLHMNRPLREVQQGLDEIQTAFEQAMRDHRELSERVSKEARAAFEEYEGEFRDLFKREQEMDQIFDPFIFLDEEQMRKRDERREEVATEMEATEERYRVNLEQAGVAELIKYEQEALRASASASRIGKACLRDIGEVVRLRKIRIYIGLVIPLALAILAVGALILSYDWLAWWHMLWS